MKKQNCVEPDFAVESLKFQKHAAELGLCLDRLPGGFYVEQKTQGAWASWIRQAAMDGYTELKRASEACKDSLSLRYMASHGELYIRNDHGIVFDVHQNRSFPEIMETNKAYADLVLAARPSAVLSLIAEIEALRADLDGEMTPARDFNLEHEELKHERDQLKAVNESLRRHCERLEADKQAMAETHVLYTWLRKKCDQPNNDVVAVHMNIGHDWATVHDLDTDLRAMIEREEP